MRVATDIGGTFTDLVSLEYDKKKQKPLKITIAKSDTTPLNLEQGIINALESKCVKLEDIEYLAHGTTVVINALTERKGAKTCLITTKGFRDVLEIARSNRPDLFNFNFIKQAPFVPRHLRLEVKERMSYTGDVIHPLNLANIDHIVKTCKQEQVEAIAICLLHSYQNPEHEKATAEKIKELLPAIPVICSHTVNREWREYERTSSTVLSAYVCPITRRYLDSLNAKLKEKGLKTPPFIMQSNGGITTVDAVKQNPITIVESGPASGVIGGVSLGKTINKKNLLILDIGGTTAKCSLVENGEISITTNYKIEQSETNTGYPIQTPVIDIVEIGNGGGSIAWVDQGNKIHVGPQSAGALPGPASYGKGGKDVTTTDANLLCGRIHPDFFLGGKVKPDIQKMNEAFSRLSSKLGLTSLEVAKGVLSVANANMVNALKLISINKGYDPRDFSLMVTGGGGPMHAAFLVDELKIPEIIVPQNAGVFSAFGMLMSDLRKDYVRTYVKVVSVQNLKHFSAIYKQMENEAVQSYIKDGFKKEDIIFEYFADMRYCGQEHYVKVNIKSIPLNTFDLENIINKFHKTHHKKYTYKLNAQIEWVNFHIAAKVLVNKPNFPKLDNEYSNAALAAYAEQEVDFGQYGISKATIYKRELLGKGTVITKPAIIAELSTTTVLPPGFKLFVDNWGNLIINKK
ncbi:MAG: hydantoinase/oxoprolinase family protein [Tenacibaculum sp.]